MNRSLEFKELTEIALILAETAHAGHVRKYTNEPYLRHCINVANKLPPGRSENMYQAALLHDTLEDTKITYDDIVDILSIRVANLVKELTDITIPEDGNRAFRMNVERIRLRSVSQEAKTIKLADLIDNAPSIIKYGKGFAKVYMAEMKALLEVLKEGDALLYLEATKIIEDYYNDI